MRFLLISQYAGSSRHGMVLRNYNWARALTRMGHEVTIVASAYGHTRRLQPIAGAEVIDGINYIWLPACAYDPSGKIGRVLSMLVFTARLYLRRFTKADVVIISSPQPFAVYPAARIARKWGAKLVFDVRDLWPLTLQHLGNVSSHHPFIRLMQRAEDYACHSCNLLTSAAIHAESYFKEHGLAKGKFIPIPNGVLKTDVAITPLPAKHAATLAALKAQGKFVIGYAGAMGIANAMHTLLSALAKAPDSIHAVLLGQGPEQQALQNMVSELGLDGRVHFLAPVAHDQVDSFLQNIDAAYLGFLASPLYQNGVSPTKMNDYMRNSVPILYSHDDSDNPVNASACGITCPAGDANALASAMATLAALPPEQRKQMGERGRVWLLANNKVDEHMKTLLLALA